MTTLDAIRGIGFDDQVYGLSVITAPDISMSYRTNVLSEQDTLSGGREPKWLAPTVQRFFQIAGLKNNWDQNGAKRVDQSLMRQAFFLLLQLMRKDTPVPTVVPTPEGCIQFEWHTNGIDLEVEVLGLANFYVFYEDMQDGIEWDGDLSYDLTRLSAFIETLSSR